MLQLPEIKGEPILSHIRGNSGNITVGQRITPALRATFALKQMQAVPTGILATECTIATGPSEIF
jgi:hypothetical protein